jgi:hypothetical protein
MNRDHFLSVQYFKDKYDGYTPITMDFTTWEGFGKLWNFAKEQEDWKAFMIDVRDNHSAGSFLFFMQLIHPDRFADAWAKWRGWKEDK